jgi:hypothetical protein
MMTAAARAVDAYGDGQSELQVGSFQDTMAAYPRVPREPHLGVNGRGNLVVNVNVLERS